MRLFHFSEEANIRTFVPRAVAVPAERRKGQEWLNGPLVWAIDDWHQPLYYFPRECPRILIWPTPATCREDREMWFGDNGARMIACVEEKGREAHARAIVQRYELPGIGFEDLGDAGMWVSREAVAPIGVERL